MGPVRTARTLFKLNQRDGFDCPGCAWPETPGHCKHGKAFLDAIQQRTKHSPVADPVRIVSAGLPDRLRAAQKVFGSTGGPRVKNERPPAVSE